MVYDNRPMGDKTSRVDGPPASSHEGAFESTDDLKTVAREVGPLAAGGSGKKVPTIMVLSGAKTGHQVLVGEDPVVVGRSKRCPLHIDDDSISRQHAMIYSNENGDCFVKDLGSTNGTFLNDEQLSNKPVLLRNNDRLQVGTHVLLRFLLREQLDAQVQELLLETARRDGLTGLYNRGYLDERVDEMVTECQRRALDLSLILFDLDHFKNINDTWGHAAGDYVLRRIASLVSGRLKDDDFVARYGGEEFAILLVDAPLLSASLLAERIRSTIEVTSFVWDDQELPVTISAGVACSNYRTPLSVLELLEAADQRLYAAKEAGRNQVVADVAVEHSEGEPLFDSDTSSVTTEGRFGSGAYTDPGTPVAEHTPPETVKAPIIREEDFE